MRIRGNRLRRLTASLTVEAGKARVLVAGSWVVYVISLAIAGSTFAFWPIVAIVPVILTAWIYGTAAGTVSGLLTFGLHAATWERLTGDTFVTGPGIAGTLTLGLIGFVIGVGRWLVGSLGEETDQLRASEAKFRAVFDSAPIPLAVVGPDGTFLDVNRATCEFVGRTGEELIGTSPEAITAPGHWAENERAIERAVAGSIDGYTIDKAWQRSDGTIVRGILKVSKYEGVDGQIYLVPQIMDLTDQLATEDALRRQLAARDTFLAAVSHELRTPLTAVTGLAKELRDRWESFEDDERFELTKMIADQGDDVAQLVEDLLVATQPEQESLALTIEPLKILNELDLVTNAMSRHPTEVIGAASPAFGDRLRTRQIIRNLISNASRYGGDTIRVELFDTDEHAVLQVIDDGAGVPEDKVGRIFEPYGRAHQPPSDHGATGLGLSVSRRLARLMNGDLSYRRVEGETVFELKLPLAP